MKLSTSPIMQQAIDHANANGGKLARYPGGFWMKPGVKLDQPDFVSPKVWSVNTWFGTQTIRALLERKLVKVSQYGKGGGRYAVEVETIKS